MSTDRDTLATLIEICNADVESARIALSNAERELEDGRAREKRADRGLELLSQRRSEECERFDRRVEQDGATIAELQLFEEHLSGLASQEMGLGDALESARRQSDEAAAKAVKRRNELNDRLVEQKLLSKRLLEKETTSARQAEEMEWEERDTLAARRHTEEA